MAPPPKNPTPVIRVFGLEIFFGEGQNSGNDEEAGSSSDHHVSPNTSG
jgi:hypothetical protein